MNPVPAMVYKLSATGAAELRKLDPILEPIPGVVTLAPGAKIRLDPGTPLELSPKVTVRGPAVITGLEPNLLVVERGQERFFYALLRSSGEYQPVEVY